MQTLISKLSGTLITQVLVHEWQNEEASLIVSDKMPEALSESAQMPVVLSKSPLVRAAEEFVCLYYLAFIQNMMGRMRTLILSIGLLFLATTISSAVYPFDPQPLLGYTFLTLFLLLTGVVTGSMRRRIGIRLLATSRIHLRGAWVAISTSKCCSLPSALR
ncbi:MAG: hypothetical protein WBW84_02460 [Acidobacteriaceae bacterium]